MLVDLPMDFIPILVVVSNNLFFDFGSHLGEADFGPKGGAFTDLQEGQAFLLEGEAIRRTDQHLTVHRGILTLKSGGKRYNPYHPWYIHSISYLTLGFLLG